MSLAQELLKVKPREESGSTTSGKYDYQKDLSLFLMLQKHESLDDYVFLFDFHDDLVILDSSENPDKLDFFQMKSKNSGNWTLRALSKSEKNKLSILGKLYANKINFGEHAGSLNFVSNAPFSFKKLPDGSKTIGKLELEVNELHADDIREINVAIKTEHSLLDDPFYEKHGAFHVSVLSHKESGTHCVGELNKLINSLNQDNVINPELAYEQIINEVSRKTKTTVGDKSINNLTKLIDLKGISKAQFVEYLKQAGLYRSVHDEWKDIKNSLEACGTGHLEIMSFKKSWVDLSATLIKDTNKIPLINLQKDVYKVLNEERENGNLTNQMNLLEIVSHCFKLITSNIYDEYFIKCLIIYKINEE